MIGDFFYDFFSKYIACYTYFKRNLRFFQVFKKFFILNCGNSVTDSFGMKKIYRIPDRFRTDIFSCMNNRVKSVFMSLFKHGCKFFCGTFRFRSAKSYSDYIGTGIFFNQIVIAHCILTTECAGNIEQEFYDNAVFFFDFRNLLRKNINHFFVVKAFFKKSSRRKKRFAVFYVVFYKIF